MRNQNVLAMISPMSPERVNGIARYAKEHGWNLMIQDRLGHTPLAWDGDGIIATLRSDPVSFKSIQTLMKRGIPLVDLTISRPSIDQNLERGGYEAAKLLNRLMSNDQTIRHPTILIPPAGIIQRRSTDVIAVADPTVRKALEFIGTNLSKPIGSPQIADYLGLKRAVLDQLFRSHLLRSVGEEIRRQRLAHAKLLLETTDISISDIARQTGYCTPSHLTNVFKAAFNQSPKDWRRNG